MEALLKNLKESMERQINLLEIMKSIEQSKHEILTQGRLFDFSGLNENISQLIDENFRIEKSREEWVKKICESMKIDYNEKITLKEILSSLENNKIKNELLRFSDALKEKVTAIKYYSKVNQELIETVMQVIDLSLSQGLLSSKDIDYTQTGRMRKERPLLVNKVI